MSLILHSNLRENQLKIMTRIVCATCSLTRPHIDRKSSSLQVRAESENPLPFGVFLRSDRAALDVRDVHRPMGDERIPLVATSAVSAEYTCILVAVPAVASNAPIPGVVQRQSDHHNHGERQHPRLRPTDPAARLRRRSANRTRWRWWPRRWWPRRRWPRPGRRGVGAAESGGEGLTADSDSLPRVPANCTSAFRRSSICTHTLAT